MNEGGMHNVLGKINDKLEANAKSFAEMAETVNQINDAILGTYSDKPGVMERLRKLENNEVRRGWWLGILIVSTLTLLASLIKDAFGWLISHAK